MKRGLRTILFSVACLSPALALGADEPQSSSSRSAAGELKKLPGGAVLRLSPGARIELGRPRMLQLGTGSAKTSTQSLRLLSGRVEVDVPVAKVPTTAVLILGPHKVSAVAKGGRSVFIASPGRVTVAAVSGEMLVASGNDWRTINSGLVREFAAGGGSRDHAVMAAPQVALSAAIALRVPGSPLPIDAAATPVPGASSYDFNLWKVEGQNKTLVARLPSNDGKIELAELVPGNYAVSVRGVEASGLEGAESESVPLRVVAAELPPGAKLEQGRIVLRPKQRVRLLGTEGVEISYGKASHFVPAPSSIGVIRGEPTLVRLRAVGSAREVPLVLEPRLVRANIELGPTRASWPRDKINVAIRLTDAAGRPLAGDIQVKPSVFVNITPVALSWKRVDNLLTAVIPHGMERGPWVVRVEVADDTGNVIGHDFLEVAAENPRHRGQ